MKVSVAELLDPVWVDSPDSCGMDFYDLGGEDLGAACTGASDDRTGHA